MQQLIVITNPHTALVIPIMQTTEKAFMFKPWKNLAENLEDKFSWDRNSGATYCDGSECDLTKAIVEHKNFTDTNLKAEISTTFIISLFSYLYWQYDLRNGVQFSFKLTQFTSWLGIDTWHGNARANLEKSFLEAKNLIGVLNGKLYPVISALEINGNVITLSVPYFQVLTNYTSSTYEDGKAWYVEVEKELLTCGNEIAKELLCLIACTWARSGNSRNTYKHISLETMSMRSISLSKLLVSNAQVSSKNRSLQRAVKRVVEVWNTSKALVDKYGKITVSDGKISIKNTKNIIFKELNKNEKAVQKRRQKNSKQRRFKSNWQQQERKDSK
jgi:hypothetical protein